MAPRGVPWPSRGVPWPLYEDHMLEPAYYLYLPSSPPKKGAEPPIFGPCLLRPNGWMDQDATWYRGRPQPRRLCVRWGPSSPPKKGTEPPPIFGPFLLWPNGWMHQGATWYRGRPQPRRLCVRRGLSYPIKKGTPTPTQFLAHVYCGQMAGWMKTPLGTEVDLGPGYTVLDGVPASAKESQQPPPLFSAHVFFLPRSPISV